MLPSNTIYEARPQSITEIEAKFRAIIKAEHNIAEFKSVIEVFRNSKDKIAQFKTEIKNTLTAEKRALETELRDLRGEHHFDGTLNDAYLRKVEVEKEMERARADFIEARNQLAAEDIDDSLFLLTIQARKISEVADRFRRIFSLSRESVAAFEGLQKRFREIVVFEGSNIVGGRLMEITRLLNSEDALEASAKDKANKIASFYEELSRDVDNNEEEFYQSLHKIIN